MKANGVITVDLDQVRIDPAWALRIPVSLAVRRRVIPFAVLKQQVYVACAEPMDATTVDALTRFTGLQVVPVQVEMESLGRALTRVYGEARGRPGPATRDTPDGDDAIALAD